MQGHIGGELIALELMNHVAIQQQQHGTLSSTGKLVAEQHQGTPAGTGKLVAEGKCISS